MTVTPYKKRDKLYIVDQLHKVGFFHKKLTKQKKVLRDK